jgi:hypothetical protein
MVFRSENMKGNDHLRDLGIDKEDDIKEIGYDGGLD